MRELAITYLAQHVLRHLTTAQERPCFSEVIYSYLLAKKPPESLMCILISLFTLIVHFELAE
jgi:hypothetical protein